MCYAFSFMFQSTYEMHYANNETLVTVTYCNDYNDDYALVFTIYQLVTCFALPASIIIVCYSFVIRCVSAKTHVLYFFLQPRINRVLWKSAKNINVLANYPSLRQTTLEQERYFTKLSHLLFQEHVECIYMFSLEPE
jgi:hypothetical protein